MARDFLLIDDARSPNRVKAEWMNATILHGNPAGLSEYRQSLGCFGTGVALVSCIAPDGRALALTINSFTSVSLTPPVTLWCIGDSSTVYDVFANADHYAINILGLAARPLSERFSKPSVHELADHEYVAAPSGAPWVKSAIAHIDAKAWRRDRVGDHLVIYGETMAFHSQPEGEGLGYFRGRYTAISRS
jgi:flavin reductase (DIM6/NTAB) family NADH-FMN oxidoreductase RutF